MNNADIIAFENARIAWANQTFPSATLLTSMEHLREEISEIQESIDIGEPDLMEFADAQMLLWDTSYRAGFDLETLFQACKDKFEINKTRNFERNKTHFSHVK